FRAVFQPRKSIDHRLIDFYFGSKDEKLWAAEIDEFVRNSGSQDVICGDGKLVKIPSELTIDASTLPYLREILKDSPKQIKFDETIFANGFNEVQDLMSLLRQLKTRELLLWESRFEECGIFNQE
ncbi:hypothetical protein PFISCL1PPCAC_20167, partial [Pristionchus fissidentatus]